MILRSLLFVPGDSEKKLIKGGSCGADALILDLEDSVAQPNKQAARELVRNYLLESGEAQRKQQLWVRINPIEDRAAALLDLVAVMKGAPDGIIQPKTNSARDVDLLGQYLDVLEVENKVPIGSTRIIPVATETPQAMLSMQSYSSGCSRLAGITWGAEDLAAALGAFSNKGIDGDWGFTYQLARTSCLLAASASQVAAIDTIYANFRDADGLRTAAHTARQDGFSGKMAIHPDQVGHINEAFTPSADEIEYARRVIEAFEGGAGVASLDGKMLDLPHLKQAQRIVAIALVSGVA